MKNLISAACLFLAIAASGQSFSISRGEVVWQGVYLTDMDYKDIYKSMIVSNDFYDIAVIDSTLITAQMKATGVDWEGAGLSYGGTPMYVTQMAIGPAFFLVEIKEEKYRITVKDIYLTNILSSLAQKGSLERLDNYAIDDDGMLGQKFIRYAMPVYQQIFEKLFTLIKVQEDEEW